MTVQLVIFAWITAAVIFAFAQTHAKRRRHWRARLVAITSVAWLVSATILAAGYLEEGPFWRAVKSGDTNKLSNLLSEKPSLVRSRTLLGYTALHLAAASGNDKTVALLLGAGADVNARGDSVTPLHLAAFYGNASATEILLNAGADVNAEGYRHKDTPLHVAALHGFPGVVRLLLRHGADVNAMDTLGKTPAQYATEQNHTNVIAALSEEVRTSK